MRRRRRRVTVINQSHLNRGRFYVIFDYTPSSMVRLPPRMLM